ncbi:MAG: hypothetical protein IKK10_00835 [Clostridia bacterium]|nr:hypothetical protein [Clostridia bacterium]
MSNTTLTVTDCRKKAVDFLEKSNLNMFLINEYLENDSDDSVTFQQYYLCRNIVFDSIFKDGLYYQDANRSDNWFRRIEDQVYKLIKHDKNYKSDSIYVHMILGGIISELINFLTESFSIDASTACGVSYLLIYTVAKIGLNAWCQKYEEDRGHNGVNEDDC